MPMALAWAYAFDLDSGTGTTNVEMDPLDLSRAKAIRLELELTGKGTADAGDLCDIYFQEASDDLTPTWDDRAHFPQMTGAMTVTAAAPEKRVIQWQCLGTTLQATDSSYEPSGSAGGSRLAAGAYIPGPLKGKRYGTGTAGMVARHRLSFTLTDDTPNSGFAGVVRVFYESGVA
jgi:hypothetical protein